MIAIVNIIFQVIYIILFARIILSWIPIDPYSSFYQVKIMVYNLTEPLMAPFRRILPPMGGLDLSPIILFLLLSVVQNMVNSAF